jgi:hypothetical protein
MLFQEFSEEMIEITNCPLQLIEEEMFGFKKVLVSYSVVLIDDIL